MQFSVNTVTKGWCQCHHPEYIISPYFTPFIGVYTEFGIHPHLTIIRFLQDHPTAFRRLHFNSHVPQSLFDAICYQKNLTELRLKWGNYHNLSSLRDLKKLQYLYLGSCSGVQDLAPITTRNKLIVLYIENFKQVTDYSSLHKLDMLEQLVISGPVLADVVVKDIDFLCDMRSLSSVWLPNVRIAKRYTDTEREKLRATNIRGIYNQQWWTL